jgi:hypothetical protein
MPWHSYPVCLSFEAFCDFISSFRLLVEVGGCESDALLRIYLSVGPKLVESTPHNLVPVLKD